MCDNINYIYSYAVGEPPKRSKDTERYIIEFDEQTLAEYLKIKSVNPDWHNF